MWVRKHRSTSAGTLLHNRNRFPGYSDTDQASVSIGSSGTITLSVGNETSNYGGLPASYGLSWSDAVTADTEWHHIVLDCNTWSAQQTTPAVSWTLYVDGVSKDTRSVGEGAYVNARGTFQNWITRVELGTGFNGHLAQVWGGDRETFALSEFYDNGFVANLPSGNKIYSLLDHPYDSTIIGKNYSDRNNTTTISLDDATFKNGERVQGYFIESNLFVDVIKSQQVGANLSTVFTQSASAIKQIVVQATLNSAFTETANNTRIRQTAVPLSALYTELTVAIKVARSPITLESSFTLTCAALAGKLMSANLNSAFTLSASYIVAKRASAALSTQATLTANNTRQRQTSVTTNTAATQAVALARTRTLVVQLATQAQLTANVIKLLGVQAFLASAFAQTVSARKTAISAVSLNTLFTETVIPNRIRRTAVALQGIYAELADGYIIHIDPYLTYAIAQETRNFLITTDVRNYLIAQETRARQIPAETRIYAVDSDTRVNTIIGSAL
jgi:hypothetical protein